MIFKPFRQQREFLNARTRYRRRGAFAGKRGGKTEIGAIEGIIHTENQIGFRPNGRDPYLGLIVAPTHDMLMRLSLKKFMAFAKPFNPHLRLSPIPTVTWGNGSIVYGMSGDKPRRMEGEKANWVWLDEIFQMQEQLYLEAQARVADNEGNIWVTGSLGVQYTNPKQHWVHKRFKQRPDAQTGCFEWATADNPHFPRDEIESLKDTLDPQTFRQMFEISWDTQSSALVYEEFDAANLINGYKYDPALETSVSVDWGWTHPAAVTYFQYNAKTDTVYQFDEIVSSRMTLDQMWERMQAKPYRIKNYYCDIAGNQEREQTGISNISWFKKPPRDIHFKYRTSAVQHGISIVRSYIKNAKGQRRFYIDEQMCPHTVDAMKNFSYEVKSGEITGEVPKSKLDCADSQRYYFVNRHDFMHAKGEVQELNRWQLLGR